MKDFYLVYIMYMIFYGLFFRFEKCVSLHESFCVFQSQSNERYKTELKQLWTNLCENQQKFSESYNDLLK